MYTSWLSNFSVYCDNLSVYYICMILLSFLAVFLTWWLQDTDRKQVEDVENDNEEANDHTEMTDNESILSQIKISRQKAIAEQLSAGLTEEQLQQEKDHVPQRVKIASGRSGTLGATALKASFMYGALTNTFFTEDTNLSTTEKFA
ncbi:uncharacterized protein LOC111865133 isoform X1 [Cryptotermes secundus]|uniref:uncharacterized protein LOC111865133 isoform X1 n=1 Tax=Cryptotermes secundus TaxID=105785 RepID=UPI000CD7C2D4|nr:uncharacterized protein LOC111865133 isoform X1 [Cryptotermes secundus]